MNWIVPLADVPTDAEIVTLRVSRATLLMPAPLTRVDWADAACGTAATANTDAAIKDKPRNFRNDSGLTFADVIATP